MQLADRNTRAGKKRFTRIRGPRNGNLAAIRFFFLLLPVRIMIQPPRYESVGGRAVPWVCVGPCWPGWLLPTVAGSRRKCRPRVHSAGILREMSMNAVHPLA